jgi:hypothetical protein
VSRGVCIIGFANSRDDVPWDRPDTEYWSLNENWDWYEKTQRAREAAGKARKDWSAWFEIHDEECIGITARKSTPGQEAHYAWMKAQTRPIYLQRVHEEIPASRAFPLSELETRFHAKAPHWKRYFTSSIGFMMAMAIAQGRDADFAPIPGEPIYEWIGLYGIDLAGDSEYVYQRPNTEWFSGFAAGLGIAVEASPASALFKGECVYGYEKPPQDTGPLTRVFLTQQIENIKKEIEKVDEMISKNQAIRNTLHGAMQAQQSNIRLLVEYAKRGVSQQNLARTSELLTVESVTRAS